MRRYLKEAFNLIMSAQLTCIFEFLYDITDMIISDILSMKPIRFFSFNIQSSLLKYRVL